MNDAVRARAAGAWPACLLLGASGSLVLGWALASLWVGVAVATPAFVLVLLRPWIVPRARQGDLPPDMHRWLEDMTRRTTNAIIITDAQRRTLWVNEGFTRISGYTIEEMLGRKPGNVLFGPRTDPETIKKMAEDLSNGRSFQGELLNQTKDGRDYWVAVDMQPRFDARGRLVGFMAIETNITDRKLAHIEHERLLAELTGFFENTAELLCIIDKQGVLAKVNSGWHDLLGQREASLLGRSILDFIHAEDVDHTRRELSMLLQDGGEVEFSNRLRDSTGQWRTLEWRASARGGLVYAAARDTTEQIRMERQLLEQAEHTEMALSVGGLGTWDWDISTGTLRMDDRWTKGIADCSNGAVGSSDAWSGWVHREDVWPTLRELAAHLRRGAPFEGVRFRVHQRGGGWRYIRATGRNVSRDNDGRPARMVGTYVDVTEQELAQVRLRDANERMDLALEAGRMGVWVWDLDNGSFTCDQRWAELLGEDVTDLLEDASTLLTRVHSDDLIALETAIERQLSGQQPYVDMQCRVRHQDGSWRWVRMFGASTGSMGDERVRRLVGIQMDVHEQVEAQAELARRETVLANTVRMAGIGGWELDLATNSMHWSDQVCEIHELPPGSVPTVEEAIQYYQGSDRQVMARCIQRAIELGEPWDVECRFITAKGRHRWVRAVGEAVFVDGKAVRLAGAFQDVTEQRAQREALEASNRALEVAQTISRMGSWSYDAQTEEVVWSKQLYQLFEMSPEHGAPTCEEALHCYRPDDVERLRAAIAEALENGTPYALTLRRNVSGNGMRYASVEGRARHDDQGRVTGLYGTVRDVTAEVEHEAELREARQRAEEANRSKTEFLANMSHEIRTPMTAILGYAELIDDPSLGRAERSKHIEIIKRNGQHLLSVINDILDVSKIESGRMDVERIEIRPHDLVRGVGQLMRATASEKGLDFSVAFTTRVPTVVRTDPTRLRQILMNLIGNALKFTSEGHVSVEVAYERRAGSGLLRIDIEDTGIGMTAEQLEHAFTAFTQADASTTRRYGGSGLGLRISKRLAQMLGGDISVQSEPGRGSVFRVAIEVESDSDVALHPAETISLEPSDERDNDTLGESKSLAGLRVLLVEDGVDNLRLIQMHLRRAGASVRTARDGLEALRTLGCDPHGATPLGSPLPVDAIVTDMQMPEMDGYTVVSKLRQMGCELPIVALTANALDSDESLCMQAGCDAYLAKPVSREMLVHAVLRSMAKRSAA